MKLFPNYSQFSSYGKGINFIDENLREYRIADGVDRQDLVERGIISSGSPYSVEPAVYFDERVGRNVIIFKDLYTFFDDSILSPYKRGLPTEGNFDSVSRGKQLLYVRIPRKARKLDGSITLPNVGDDLKIIHEPTESLVTGKILEVDGFQFPNPSTGSVLVDDLVFFNDNLKII
jgi:hypothetical protein